MKVSSVSWLFRTRSLRTFLNVKVWPCHSSSYIHSYISILQIGGYFLELSSVLFLPCECTCSVALHFFDMHEILSRWGMVFILAAARSLHTHALALPPFKIRSMMWIQSSAQINVMSLNNVFILINSWG